VIDHLRALEFTETRRRFREEFLRHPRFEDGLAAMLRDYGWRPLEEHAREAGTTSQEELQQLCA
jgi:hypothetical protein